MAQPMYELSAHVSCGRREKWPGNGCQGRLAWQRVTSERPSYIGASCIAADHTVPWLYVLRLDNKLVITRKQGRFNCQKSGRAVLLKGERASEIARLHKREGTASQKRKQPTQFVVFKGDRTRQKQEVLSFLHPATFSMESQVCTSITSREKRPKRYHLQFFFWRKIQRSITRNSVPHFALSTSPVHAALWSHSHWNTPVQANYDPSLNLLHGSCSLAPEAGLQAGRRILCHSSPEQRFRVHIT